MPGSAVSSRSAAVAVGASAALFGLTGTVADLGPDDLRPFVAGVWRSMIGGLVLIAAAWARRTPIWRYSLRSRWIVIGGLGVVVYQLAFFEAVDRTGVALGTLVTIGGGPPIAGLLDAVLQRRPPARSWYGGSAVAIAGVALLSSGSTDADGVGILLAVAAATSFPFFGVASQRLMEDRPFLPAMATTFGAGALLLSPIAATTAGEATRTAGSVATVAVLGVVTLAAAYWLWGIGLDRLALSVVVTMTLLEPAVAAILAVTIVGEPLTGWLIAGLALVGTGVWLSARPTRPAPTEASHPPIRRSREET